MNVVTLYFAYSIVLLSSMAALAAIFAPILGALSDRLGKKMPFLIVLVIAVTIFTIAIGIAPNLLLGLLAFLFANLFYQLADVFYNALLPTVSLNNKIGFISGLGKSVGYLGPIFGILLVGPLAIYYGRQAVFIPTAILFLLFALPGLFIVGNNDHCSLRDSSMRGIIFAALMQIKNTLLHIKKYKIDHNTFCPVCSIKCGIYY
jgi:MFS transporter, UMF1 family